jgi:integrase
MDGRTAEAIEEYLARLKRSNRSDKTIATYRTALLNCMRYLQERGMHSTAARIGEDEVVALVNGYPASEVTVHYYIKALGQFLAWMGNRTVQDMSLLWNEPAHPCARWITVDEFGKILTAIQDPTDRIIIVLAAYAGMRRSEIAVLLQCDILSDRMIVTGKGHGKGKQRVIPLSTRLRAEIGRYMAYRRRYVADTDVPALVVSFPCGRPPTGMAAGTVGKRVRRICDRAGVDASPHSFRRYFATRIWDTMPDKDIKILQALLGHSSPVITSRYIHTDAEAMAEAMSRI